MNTIADKIFDVVSKQDHHKLSDKQVENLVMNEITKYKQDLDRVQHVNSQVASILMVYFKDHSILQVSQTGDDIEYQTGTWSKNNNINFNSMH